MARLLTFWKINSFLCPVRLLRQEEGSYYVILAKEIAQMPIVPWQMQRKTLFLSAASLVNKTLKSCKEQFGGSCCSTLGSEHLMRVESLSGVM